MVDPHVITALVAKRARLAGEIIVLDRRARSVRTKIAHIDSCLGMFGYEGDPRQIAPITPQGARLFRRGQLQRTVLSIRREATHTVTNKEIAAEIIRRMNWNAEDSELLFRLSLKVKDVTKRYPLIVASNQTNSD